MLDNTLLDSFANEPGITTIPDYKAILQSCLVTIHDVIEVPPVCIEVISNGCSSTVGTLGNISLVIGKAKQGKTFAISMALAAAEKQSPFNDVLKVNLPFSQSNILFFDTEQSRYHVHRVIKRICVMSNKQVPQSLITYGLRSKTPAERLQLIEYALYNFDNIGLVVIDGIRDLVTSINDEEQGTMITSKLLKWTEEKNIHIVTVLHMNKGDNNARGHLGTELTNKSETVISVSKLPEDKEIAIIQAEYCRDKDFEPFAFKIDDNGIPHILSDWSIETSAAKRKSKALLPGQIDRSTHFEILSKVMKVDPRPKLRAFLLSLGNEINSWYNFKVPASTIESYLQYYLDNEIVFKHGNPPQTRYTLQRNLPLDTTE